VFPLSNAAGLHFGILFLPNGTCYLNSLIAFECCKLLDNKLMKFRFSVCLKLFYMSFHQVRMMLVQSWLPVLNVCRDIVQPMHFQKSTNCQELEEAFLQIISTLPVPEAQELLQQCLGFSTRNVDDCPHLVAAFKTWFRRAGRLPLGGEN
jgi:hypothetical protein